MIPYCILFTLRISAFFYLNLKKIKSLTISYKMLNARKFLQWPTQGPGVHLSIRPSLSSHVVGYCLHS